jgi:hypothetical protein
MNGKYNREAICIGEATWLVGTKEKAVRRKLMTAAAVFWANCHGRFQRDFHMDLWRRNK